MFQVGSNERKSCRDGLGTNKWSVVSDIVGGFLLVGLNMFYVHMGEVFFGLKCLLRESVGFTHYQ